VEETVGKEEVKKRKIKRSKEGNKEKENIRGEEKNIEQESICKLIFQQKGKQR
jgi:hypothetical protein